MSTQEETANNLLWILEAEALVALGLHKIYKHYLDQAGGDMEKAKQLMELEHKKNPDELRLMVKTQRDMVNEYVKRRLNQVSLHYQMKREQRDSFKN